MYIIYGKPNCIFCDKAKALLTMRGEYFSYRDINVPSHWEDMKKWFPDAQTVPQIVKAFKHFAGHDSFVLLGGYTQLQEYLK